MGKESVPFLKMGSLENRGFERGESEMGQCAQGNSILGHSAPHSFAVATSSLRSRFMPSSDSFAYDGMRLPM